MANKSPAFQFYPDKALTGTQHLSPEAFKAYWIMLCWMWLHSPDHYSIPDNQNAWAIAMQLPVGRAKKCMEEIQNKHMKLLHKSRKKLYSLGLKKEVEKQKKNREQAKNAANTRWSKEKHKMRPHCERIDLASIPQCTPTPTPIPTVLNKQTEGEDFPPLLYDLPSLCVKTDALFSPTKALVTDLYKKTRRDYKLPAIVDTNAKEGVLILTRMVDASEITMEELQGSLRSFCKKQKKGGDFDNWHLKGFANNVGMFPPDKPTPVAGATSKPTAAKPDKPGDKEALTKEMKAVLANEGSSQFMRERAAKYLEGK